MKFWKVSVCAVLVSALAVLPLVGCSDQGNTGDFSYSKGIDDNGYWKDINASNYVELPDYESIDVPYDSYVVTDDAVQTEIDSLLASYATTENITDRAVADGDSVNIDYVGSVDGVEFDNGSTNGAGTDVTIGVTSYIDDFLEQLIGHMPGETFNVEVTFPEPYENNPELAGKDAVFVTTINFISEETKAELTDDFVAENLSAYGDWKTVDQMRAGIKSDLEKQQSLNYVTQYLVTESKVDNIPESLIEYQNNAVVSYYEEYAEYYSMTMEEFLSSYMGAESIEEMLESNEEATKESATYYLVIQAIAEEKGFKATNEDVQEYFSNHMGTDDYSSYEEQYGLPYLKQVTLAQMVLDYVNDQAVLLPEA